MSLVKDASPLLRGCPGRSSRANCACVLRAECLGDCVLSLKAVKLLSGLTRACILLRSDLLMTAFYRVAKLFSADA